MYRVRRLPGYLFSETDLRRTECTVRVDSLPHRKWREIQQQPGTAGPGNMLGYCLIFFHFLWGKLSTHTVHVFFCRLSSMHFRSCANYESKLPLKIGIQGDGGLCTVFGSRPRTEDCLLIFKVNCVKFRGCERRDLESHDL